MKASQVLKAIFVSLVIAGGTVALSRLSFRLLEQGAFPGEAWLKRRVRESVPQLPNIAKTQGPLTIAIGASDLETSFHPMLFDADLAAANISMTSYNLSVRNISLLLPAWSTRIREELSEEQRIADVIIVKFSPARATMATSAGWREMYVDDIISLLIRPSTVFRDYARNPERMLRIMSAKWLFDGSSASSGLANAKVILYNNPLFERSRRASPAGLVVLKQQEALIKLWQNPVLHDEIGWDPAQRGGYYWGLPGKQSEFDKVAKFMQDPEEFQIMVDWHVDNFDGRNLKFDPDLVTNFIGMLKDLKRVSRHVVLAHFPDAPQFQRTTETEARISLLLKKMAQQSGATLIEYTREDFEAEDYLDPLHLSYRGHEKFNQLLARDIAKLLQPNPPK